MMLSVGLSKINLLSVANQGVIYPEGEFHVDLYTLPEGLIKMLWEFTNEKVGVS